MPIKFLITKLKNRIKNTYQFWYIKKILNRKNDQYKSLLATLMFENDITNKLVKTVLTTIIYPRTQKEQKNILEHQQRLLVDYMVMASNTKIGKKYNFEDILIHNQKIPDVYKIWAKNTPIFNYDQFKPRIDETKNKPDIIRPGMIKMYSASAGTTAVDQENGNKKHIPVSHESMKSFTKAGQDMLAEYVQKYPRTKMFKGLSLPLVGSIQELSKTGIVIGDVSALTLLERSRIVKNKYAFNINDLIHKDRNQKRKIFANKLNPHKNLVMIGVTSRANELLDYREQNIPKKYHKLLKNNNIEAIIGGGVAVNPYIKKFNKLGIKYIGNYNASEGIFGYQNITDYDNTNGDAPYRLLGNHGNFYEFVPFNDQNFNEDGSLKKNAQIKPLRELDWTEGKVALLITTNSGLLRYMIGDVIEFTDKNYHFKIVGRTKQCLNLKGEELMETHTNYVIEQINQQEEVQILNYTIAPDQINDPQKHQRIIEGHNIDSEQEEYLTKKIDYLLQNINPDYKAKRDNDMLLKMPEIIFVDKSVDIFTQWLSKRGKLGGQNKIPKLSQNRKVIEEILEIIEK